MSQHSDILTFEISQGIIDGLGTTRIVQRIQGILDACEWDDATVDAVPSDCLISAHTMLMQKDGLYGASHDQLKQFMKNLTQEYNLNPVGFN